MNERVVNKTNHRGVGSCFTLRDSRTVLLKFMVGSCVLLSKFLMLTEILYLKVPCIEYT